MRDLARFAHALGPHLRGPERPPSPSSPRRRRSSRCCGSPDRGPAGGGAGMVRDNHQPACMLADTQLSALGTPQLVVLPSAQALSRGGLELAPRLRRERRRAPGHGSGRSRRVLARHRPPGIARPRRRGRGAGPARLRAAPRRRDGAGGLRAKSAVVAQRARFRDGASCKEITHGEGRLLGRAAGRAGRRGCGRARPLPARPRPGGRDRTARRHAASRGGGPCDRARRRHPLRDHLPSEATTPTWPSPIAPPTPASR